MPGIVEILITCFHSDSQIYLVGGDLNFGRTGYAYLRRLLQPLGHCVRQWERYERDCDYQAGIHGVCVIRQLTMELSQDNPRPPGQPGVLPVRLLQRSWRLDLHLLANHLRPTAPNAQRRPAMPLRWECNREAREIHEKKSASRRKRLTRFSVASGPQW